MSHLNPSGPLSTFTRRLHTFSRLIEQPSLFQLRRRGGMVQTYFALDQTWLHHLNIRTVFDIGANVGSFAITAAELFPRARVFAFEPLAECYAQLEARTAHLPQVRALNLALGEQPGRLNFQRYSFSPSSSFLKPSQFFNREQPWACETEEVEVEVQTLDNLAPSLDVTEPILAKLDVQGYEDRVLHGGEQTFRRASVIIAETSFKAQYEQQPLFDDINALLLDFGFHYAGALDQLTSADGAIVQQDSIFINEGRA